jgi:class 3 adenylate cyclase
MIETFAFTDIVGSTDTEQRLGDEAYLRTMRHSGET